MIKEYFCVEIKEKFKKIEFAFEQIQFLDIKRLSDYQ